VCVSYNGCLWREGEFERENDETKRVSIPSKSSSLFSWLEKEEREIGYQLNRYYSNPEGRPNPAIIYRTVDVVNGWSLIYIIQCGR